MNIPIRLGILSGCLLLLGAVPAWATPPNLGNLPPGSGILVPPGQQPPGPTYQLKNPPRFPGQWPETVPPWLLKKHVPPYAKPLPRPLVHPKPGPKPHLPGPAMILPYRPKPFTPVIPLPPPRGPQVRPWTIPPRLGPAGRPPALPPIRMPLQRLFRGH
jgi:hypothetical protein